MSYLFLFSFYNIHSCNHKDENFSYSIKLKVDIKIISVSQVKKWRQREGVTNPRLGFLFLFT